MTKAQKKAAEPQEQLDIQAVEQVEKQPVPAPEPERGEVVKVQRQEVADPAAAPGTSESLMQVIGRLASDPSADIDKMERLIAMKERIDNQARTAEFNDALSSASGEMPQVFKRGKASLGGKGGYTFAKWEDMDRAIRPVLEKHGLRLSFNTQDLGGGVLKIIGKVTHRNGISETSEMDMPIDTGPGRSALQQRGSTISYGKRYTTEMLLNIARTDEDNDGAPVAQRAEVISPEQKEEIINLLQQVGDPNVVKGFLAHYTIDAVDRLPAAKFAGARAGLLRKVAAHKAAQSGEKKGDKA